MGAVELHCAAALWKHLDCPTPQILPCLYYDELFSKGHQKGPYTFSFVFFKFQAATSAQAEFQHVQDAIDTCRLLYFTVQEFLVLLT